MRHLSTVFRFASWMTLLSVGLGFDAQPAQAALHTTKASCEADGWTWLEPYRPPVPQASDPSLVAAAVMGADGFSRGSFSLPVNWQTVLLGDCVRDSPAGNQWFGGCSPIGVVKAINSRFTQNWRVVPYNSGIMEQIAALQGMVDSTRYYKSPAVLPIYGRGDHFLTSENFCVKFYATGAIRSFDVSRFHDGVIAWDGAGNASFGTTAFSGNDFLHKYYEILSNIGPNCPIAGTCSDPYYEKFIYMYDPPVGSSLRASPVNPEMEFVRAPGIVGKGEMTAARATQEVRRSLHEAGFLADPQVARRLDQGMVLASYPVTLLGRKGARTESYIVPIRADRGGVSLFVRMSGEDGAIESLFTPDTPFTYQPVSSQQALTLGLALVHGGERLGEGHLVWDAALSQPDIRHPHQPFFEFPVLDAAGHATEGIWVAMQTGRVIGRGPLRVPSVQP